MFHCVFQIWNTAKLLTSIRIFETCAFGLLAIGQKGQVVHWVVQEKSSQNQPCPRFC